MDGLQLKQFGQKLGLKAGPLTRAQVDVMDSRTYSWHESFNDANLDAVLHPKPTVHAPPPLIPRAEILKQAVADALGEEYKKYLKERGGEVNSFTFDAFVKSKREAAQLKDLEQQVEEWLTLHEEFIQTQSNRQILWGYLNSHRLTPTVTNLELAYRKTANKLELKPPDSDWQSGAWRNGRWIPDGTGAVQRRNVDPSRAASEEKTITKRISQMGAREFLFNLNESPSFRQKVDES
jgi:hypothetical protein